MTLFPLPVPPETIATLLWSLPRVFSTSCRTMSNAICCSSRSTNCSSSVISSAAPVSSSLVAHPSAESGAVHPVPDANVGG